MERAVGLKRGLELKSQGLRLGLLCVKQALELTTGQQSARANKFFDGLGKLEYRKPKIYSEGSNLSLNLLIRKSCCIKPSWPILNWWLYPALGAADN